MKLTDYKDFLRVARRHTRTDADAADLLHEALLAGVRADRLEFSTAKNKAWLSGVIRNIAASTSRAAGRRRHRESDWARQAESLIEPTEEQSTETNAILADLSQGTRRVAVLALHGMNPEEICFVLQLKPAAFRQRLTSLRRKLGTLQSPLREEALALAYTQPRRSGSERLDFGLIRRALLHHVRDSSVIGTHDPDGHLFGIVTR